MHQIETQGHQKTKLELSDEIKITSVFISNLMWRNISGSDLTHYIWASTVVFSKSVHFFSLLVPRIKNHLSSFEPGFLNIFSRQNLLRSLSLVLILLQRYK